MKCTECPEYNECSKKYNLTIRRRRCPKAKEEKVVTNADRIRAMSDEELAEVFGKLVHCGGCPMRDNCKVDNLPCNNVLLEWLQQPVRED